MLDPQSQCSICPVNSHNEWDPLEEVIVGNLDGAMFPDWNVVNRATVGPGEWDQVEKRVGGAGRPYPPEMVAAARADLAGLIHVLEAEGVKVRQVAAMPFDAAFSTPAWSVKNGFCAANPRDPFMVIGNEILEAPMADRSRYFESWPYREAFKDYFRRGAKWTAAPRPQLLDDLYDLNYTRPQSNEPMRYILNDFEPVFDAADFVRCGRDIFCQQSNVTNSMGIEWMRRHLGEGYRVHELHNLSPEAIHIDTSFMPLAPGKVLVSPEYIDIKALPDVLKTWDILVAPPPVPHQCPLGVLSQWISVNVLMLDTERVIVEKRQEPLIQALKAWGFKPIPLAFEGYFPFLGSFHCATLDIRRRGSLESYF